MPQDCQLLCNPPKPPMENTILTAQEYRLLVEQSPILIWRADLSMGCDYFNDRWLAFTGRSIEQERGNGWAEGVHSDDLTRCIDIYTRNFAKQQAFEMEYRLKRHDGMYRWIFDRGCPCYDEKGAFVGFIGSCIDVTDRVEAQRALQEAHAMELRRLRGLLPICASCKKIRDDSGYWSGLEEYIRAHSEAEFTHSICPDCAQRLYPGMEKSHPCKPPRGNGPAEFRL
jgi:PAS domain S-box-containing protein